LLGGFYPDDLQKKRFDLIQRTLALADSPRCRFLQKGQEAWVKRQLLVAWEKVVTAHPELRPPTPLPWDAVRSLLDFKNSETRLHALKVVGNRVYAAACGFEKDRTPFMQLIRV